MTKLEKTIRTLVCAPAGYVGGTLIAFSSLGLTELFLDGDPFNACLGCLATGLVYPFAVYQLGMSVAPKRGETGRYFMQLVNWVLLFLASIDLTQLLLAIPVEEEPLLQSISAWCETLMISSGMAIGCWWVLQQEKREAELQERGTDSSPRPKPVVIQTEPNQLVWQHEVTVHSN